jgi:hypothetical protein
MNDWMQNKNLYIILKRKKNDEKYEINKKWK